MTRGLLLAGNESSLYSAVAAEAAKRVESHVSAIIPNRFPMSDGGKLLPPKAETGAAGAIPFSWNPGSPIAARTLVLGAENRLETIHDAILICSPPALYKSAGALSPQEIDILINDHIKGWFFLIRELILYFRGKGKGSLSLVMPEINFGIGGKNSPVDILGHAAAASFQAFANSVLASSADEPFNLMGFTGFEAGSEAEFAAWVFKIIDENLKKNSFRWHRYSKLKFFR